MNYEIAHINISVKSSSAARAELEAVDRERQAYAQDEGIAGCPWIDDDDGKPVVNWHVDSYPFVCVTMLSDCASMVGGETALRTKDGTVMKVRGPQMASLSLSLSFSLSPRQPTSHRPRAIVPAH